MTGPEVHLHADVSGHGRVALAGRDLHIHYGDGVRRAVGEPVGECPYPGLAAFTTEQAAWFFGREALTAQLCARLADRLEDSGPLIVAGPSGSGKSSLLRAGLLAAVSERGVLPVAGSHEWPQLVLTPTAAPLAALAEGLSRTFGTRDWSVDPAGLAAAVAAAVGTARLVVVVDQLEELFTLCPDIGERRLFLDLVAALAAGPCLVVYGVRLDAYPFCAEYPSLRAAAQDGQVIVGPMTAAELRHAVVCPARAGGLDIEPGLIDLLLRDLGVSEDGYEAGRLPLLAHALRALWRERHGHLLTVEGYRVAGGIHDAIANTAERVYTRLDDGAREAARRLFVRLVKIGDGIDDTRRTIVRADLPGDGAVLDAFAAARLLVENDGAVAITHEALLRAWPRLRRWLDDNRAGHLTRQLLEETAVQWDRDGRDDSLLYRGARLGTARDWVRTSGADLSPTATTFYTASIHQHIRGRRRRRVLVALLAVLILTASAAAGLALHQRASALAVRKQILVAQLVAQADSLRREGTPDSRVLAAQLDLTAWKLWNESGAQTENPAVYTGLVSDAATPIPLPPQRLGADPWVFDEGAVARFSPDGRIIAIVTAVRESARSTLRFWHLDFDGSLTPFSDAATLPPSPNNDSVTFSPDGKIVAIGVTPGSVQLWSVSPSPRQLGQIDDNEFGCVPDPKLPCRFLDEVGLFTAQDTIAVGHSISISDDPGGYRTTLWNIADPAEPRLIEGQVTAPTGKIVPAAADAERHLLVTDTTVGFGTDDQDLHALQVWNVTNPRTPTVLSTLRPASVDDRTPPRGVTILPGRTRLASLNVIDGRSAAIFWEFTSNGNSEKIGHIVSVDRTNSFVSTSYRRDGVVVALADANDRSIALWTLADPSHPTVIGQRLTGYGIDVHSVDYSPDSRYLVSGTLFDGEVAERPVLLWNFDTAMNIRRLCATTPVITEPQWTRYVSGVDYDPPCRPG